MRQMHDMNDKRVFVFGSNLQGIHGAGGAFYASQVLGVPNGTAHSAGAYKKVAYAIPTCSRPGVPLSLPQIKVWVDGFLQHATAMLTVDPAVRFYISEIACGFAKYKPEQIAPMFRSAPSNCDLPDGWHYLARFKLSERVVVKTSTMKEILFAFDPMSAEKRSFYQRVGVVEHVSDSHGLCYRLNFGPLGSAWFDPEELEAL